MRESIKNHWLWIFLLYLLLSIILTWPLAVNFSRYPIFDHLDITMCFAGLYWQYQALVVLKVNPWFDTLINYPDLYSTVFFPLTFVYGILSLPFQALFGTPRALPGFFNWFSILSFTFTGFLGFLLFQKFSKSKSGAILAGILFSFLPFHYWHLPRTHISCLEFVLLTILCYFRLLENKRLREGIYFGLSLTVLFYQSPNYLAYLFIFFSLHLVYMLFTDRGQLDQRWLKAIVLAFALTLVLASPYLWTALTQLRKLPPVALITPEEQSRFSADLIGFFLPGFNQKIYAPVGRFAESLVGTFGVSGKEIFPGYLLLLSGIGGIFLARKKIKSYGFWLLTLLVFFILSLGPYLNFMSHTFFNPPLPYFFLRKIFPFFQLERAPVRMVILALLALAIFAVGFFQWLEEKISSRKRQMIFLALGALGLLELNQAPIKVDQIPLPLLYQELAREPEEFAILELPLLPDIYQYSAFYQMWHKKYLAIYPLREGAEAFVNYPLYLYLAMPEKFLALAPETQASIKNTLWAELKRRKIKYIIVWRRFAEENYQANLEQLMKILGPERVFASEDLFRVYQFKI